MVKSNTVETPRNAQTTLDHKKGRAKPAKKVAPVVVREKKKAIYVSSYLKVNVASGSQLRCGVLGHRNTRKEAIAVCLKAYNRVIKALGDEKYSIISNWTPTFIRYGYICNTVNLADDFISHWFTVEKIYLDEDTPDWDCLDLN